MTRMGASIVGALLLLLPLPARGQDSETPSRLVWEIAKSVALDPTTYAPAVIAYGATMWDWRTSQLLFANGWVEANPHFTVSGKPNDVPVDYRTGTGLIRNTSLTILGYSAAHNAAVNVGERLLVRRFPSHGKLIKVLSWSERIAYAALVTYRNSAGHIRQARENRRLARAYGYSP